MVNLNSIAGSRASSGAIRYEGDTRPAMTSSLLRSSRHGSNQNTISIMPRTRTCGWLMAGAPALIEMEYMNTLMGNAIDSHLLWFPTISVAFGMEIEDDNRPLLCSWQQWRIAVLCRMLSLRQDLYLWRYNIVFYCVFSECFLSTHADRQSMDISVAVCFLRVCTVTNFPGKDKASGVKFCTVVQGRPGQGTSNFGGTLLPQKSKIGRIGARRVDIGSACVDNRQSLSLTVLVETILTKVIFLIQEDTSPNIPLIKIT